MTYQQLMIKDLQDLYQAEAEQEHQLPQLAKEATNQALRTALEEHVTQTQAQVLRLRQIFEMLGVPPGGDGEVPAGVKGLVSETRKRAEQVRDAGLKDLELIAETQKLEHYEMACYGTARAMAHTLDLPDAAHLLQDSLREEEAADKRLTDVAMPIHKQVAENEPVAREGPCPPVRPQEPQSSAR